MIAVAARKSARYCLAAVVLAVFICLQACDVVEPSVAERSCAALKDRVDAVSGTGPLLLRSYDAADAGNAPPEPALPTAAFVYDEALAVIALIACDASADAARIGEALRMAATADSRLRNVYRAGPVGDAVLRNGWWDPAQNRWVEDAYQVGTATGNVAWVALAMLALHDATGDEKWLIAARDLGRWIVTTQSDPRGAGGFRGGIDGFDDAAVSLQWKSTEHALDLIAVFDWLALVDPSEPWATQAAIARAFVDAQWDQPGGYFTIGSDLDGVQTNRQSSALDVQLWAQLIAQPSPDWQRALSYAERAHGVDCGFDFNADRDGVWLEGTAQAALAYKVVGNAEAAQRRLDCIAGQFSPSGYVYATREPRLTTGLAADSYYFRLPHLGATAWTALAALGRNPYVAQR